MCIVINLLNLFFGHEFQHSKRGPLEAGKGVQEKSGKERILFERSEFIASGFFQARERTPIRRGGAASRVVFLWLL